MRFFATENGKIWHIIKEDIINPSFSYNRDSIKLKALCSVNCEKKNASLVIMEIEDSIYICKNCLRSYKQ